MKKVVHIIPSLEIGGVEKGVVSSLESMVAAFDFRVLVLGRIDPVLLNDIPAGYRRYIVGGRMPSLPFGGISALVYLLRFKPDFVISSLYKSGMVSLLYKKLVPGVRLLAFFHSANHVNAVDRFIQRKLARNANAVLADSASTGKYLYNNFAVKQSTVVPYFFNDWQMPPPRRYRPNSFRSVFLGRIEPEKGLDLAIKLCKKLALAGIDIAFDIYGVGSELSRLQSLAADLQIEGRVRFNGYLPVGSSGEVLRRYDFFIQFSSYEGMALSVTEAMIQGVIPVVTPVGEIGSYGRDMVNCLLLDHRNEAELSRFASKLVSVLKDDNLLQSISRNASLTFQSRTKYSDKLVEVINDI